MFGWRPTFCNFGWTDHLNQINNVERGEEKEECSYMPDLKQLRCKLQIFKQIGIELFKMDVALLILHSMQCELQRRPPKINKN